jgi:subtilisin family serine protease
MRRILTVGFVFIAVSAFGQATYDTNIRIEKADGSVVLIPTVAPPLDSVIVEFRDAPMAVASLSKTAGGPPRAEEYRAAFTRFRADLRSVAHGAEVRWEYFRVFNGASVRVSRSELAAIAQLPYVKRIHADHEVHATAGASTGQIGAERVWALGSRGKGVVVAIIDTGIDYNHEALGMGIGPGFKIIGGYDFANDDADPFDDNGHGTHVAGIIAGDSATITGVAPDATLIAYKALHASGSGSESDVIAAIERAADPNGDGNMADHVDVVNLSLGGSGGPDDAGSRAVDNGTQAGIVFCIAAGNSGKYHNVSSPGTARTAITVGAVDASDTLAAFSSRGPTPKDLTMKPEVSAPGVNINSSLPNNRYGLASGTSMATPHVAGACALLKALHPDWTPAKIKMELMLTAFAKNQETMSVGSGRIDVGSAADGTLAVDKASIDFGLDPIQQPTWSPSKTIHLTNGRGQSITWTLSTSTVAGVTASVSPQTLTLGPGESGDVTLSITVDNATVVVSPQSLSTAGVITMTSSSGTMHVPWTLVKGVRATVTWQKEFATVLWLDAARTTYYDSVPVDSNVSEALLAAPGDYDIAVFGSSVDEQANVLRRASLIYLEGRHLDGDVTIATTEAQASHLLRGATTTPDGKVLQSDVDQTFAISGRLVWPAGSKLKSLSISPLPLHDLHLNDVSEANTLLFNETFIDFRDNTIYAIQHPPLKGLKGDVILAAGNVKSAPVQLLIPSSPHNDARIVAQVTPTSGPGETLGGVTISHGTTSSVWNGRMFLTPDADPNYSAGIGFTVITDATTRYQTPLMHVLDGAITANATSTPVRFDGNLFIFGGGPHLATATFTNVNELLHPSLAIDLFGPRGEIRTGDRGRSTIVTLDAAGKQKASVVLYPAPLDLSAKAPFTLEVTNDATQYLDITMLTKLTMKADSSRADYLPPTLTSLYIVDGTGMATRTVSAHDGAAIFFSAADYSYSPLKTYQQIRADATTLSYRYAGATAWTPLSVAQIGEDPFAGFLYRCDLTNVANTEFAMVELKIDLQDNAGNTTSVVMLPAFLVAREHAPRHRAAR